MPEYNLVLEPGEYEHFIPINRWGGEDELKKIKERDKRKYNYCIQNGITILNFRGKIYILYYLKMGIWENGLLISIYLLIEFLK